MGENKGSGVTFISKYKDLNVGIQKTIRKETISSSLNFKEHCDCEILQKQLVGSNSKQEISKSKKRRLRKQRALSSNIKVDTDLSKSNLSETVLPINCNYHLGSCLESISSTSNITSCDSNCVLNLGNNTTIFTTKQSEEPSYDSKVILFEESKINELNIEKKLSTMIPAVVPTKDDSCNKEPNAQSEVKKKIKSSTKAKKKEVNDQPASECNQIVGSEAMSLEVNGDCSGRLDKVVMENKVERNIVCDEVEKEAESNKDLNWKRGYNDGKCHNTCINLSNDMKEAGDEVAETSNFPEIEGRAENVDINRVLTKIEGVKCKPDNVTEEVDRRFNKTKEEIMAERELRKKAKQAAKQKNLEGNKNEMASETKQEKKPDENKQKDMATSEKSKAELRAERRAKQEADRAAKEVERQRKAEEAKGRVTQNVVTPSKTTFIQKEKKIVSGKPNQNRVKLFSHLNYESPNNEAKILCDVDAGVVALGAKYGARVVSGSNSRCLAFLQSLKQVIMEYTTPCEKELPRGLETQLVRVVNFLNQSRPLSVSMTNALRHVKSVLSQLPNTISDDEARTRLCEVIETYIRDQVHVATVAISKTVQKKISDGDVILTYGCSSLVYQLLVESHRGGTKFSVVVVDAGPWFEGRQMLRKLVTEGISSTYVLINAISFIMRQASKVLIGAHGLLANGYVMSRAGSSLVSLVAHSCNVPVLVCCETHKFSERVQTDAFVYNELGNPDDIVGDNKDLLNWRQIPSLSPLNLLYDVTPPDLVTAVVTELAVLPCTSVPVILRIKPSDVVTYN